MMNCDLTALINMYIYVCVCVCVCVSNILYINIDIHINFLFAQLEFAVQMSCDRCVNAVKGVLEKEPGESSTT